MKLFQNKIWKISFKIVETIIFLLLLGYLCFVIVQRVTNNGSIMGYRVYTIASGSMNPKYKIHDVILVHTVEVKELKVGDDIAYRGERGDLQGILVSHRIIKIEKETNGKLRFYTKGINNDVTDPSFTEERIIGKVMGKIPVINFLNHIVKNQIGFFFCVFCPLVLVIVLEILETITDIKLDKQELTLHEGSNVKVVEEDKKEVSEEDSTEVKEDKDVEETESTDKQEEVEEKVEEEIQIIPLENIDKKEGEDDSHEII